MKPHEIGASYDQISDRWASEKFNHENGIKQHRHALRFVKKKERALDVGCGCNPRFAELLQSMGFEVEGIDISTEMIRKAREKNPDRTFYHADICQWVFPKQYDFITAWDSIWHIPMEEQVNVLTKIIEGLKPGGVFIFSCAGLDEPDIHIDDAMGPKVFYSSLGVNGFLRLFMDLGCQCKHFELDQLPLEHAFFIIQKM